MNKITTEQFGEMATTTSSILMAIIFGWSIANKEPVTIVISVLILAIVISLHVILVLRRLKDNGKYIS